ncbi:DUF3006 domain-containing protein [Bacillus kwashiorkori]|uniref:DUF3006 domain-containing protein n=1 Tax=Bacillus kwashiorkori TaxID=1522318 RepID=UPI001EF04497|nr:DUF3006 domain-containing protein [Bacillus kwashiorkori]
MVGLKKGIVDRFEGDWVIIEIDGKTYNIEKSKVHPHVKVDDVVILMDEQWRTDEAETRARSKQIKQLMDSVWDD